MIFEPEPNVIVEFTRFAFVIELAGRETDDVAVSEPIVRLPIVVEAKLASVEEADVEKMALGKMAFDENERVHVLSDDRS